MITLEQLQSFVAVVDRGSFKAAANQLFISKATVSLRMSALSDELGFDLFVKKRGDIILTERGAQLFEIAQEMMKLSERIEEMKRNVEISNTIHICAGNSFIVRQLLDPVMDFQKRNPSVQIELEGTPAEQLFNKISRGTADIVITWEDFPATAQMLKHQLFTLPFGLVCHRKHTLSNHGSVSMQELAGYPMIMRKKNTISRKTLDTWFSRAGKRPIVLLEVNSNDDIVTAIAANFGGENSIGITTRLTKCDGTPCCWIPISNLPPLTVYAYTRAAADSQHTQRLINMLMHLSPNE